MALVLVYDSYALDENMSFFDHTLLVCLNRMKSTAVRRGQSLG